MDDSLEIDPKKIDKENIDTAIIYDNDGLMNIFFSNKNGKKEVSYNQIMLIALFSAILDDDERIDEITNDFIVSHKFERITMN